MKETLRKRLSAFGASGSWPPNFVSRHALRSIHLHGEESSVGVSEVAADIDTPRYRLLQFRPEFIFNMDETGLFFKLFPKIAYVLPGEDHKSLRGTKAMKSKDRITAYVCTNATATLKVPFSVIGKSANPRCFKKAPPPVTYFNQENAWSDSITFTKWYYEVFLVFVHRTKSDRVVLLMDNCGPHGSDLCDSRMQVTILTLPPNCTSMYQPMDMGVIAAMKLHYRSLLLNRITSTVEHRAEMRRAAQHLKAGARGLDEGYDPHMLDATELVGEAWEKISVATIARCWIKAKILPTEVQEALIMKHGKPRVREDVRRKRDELDRLAEILKNYN